MSNLRCLESIYRHALKLGRNTYADDDFMVNVTYMRNRTTQDMRQLYSQHLTAGRAIAQLLLKHGAKVIRPKMTGDSESYSTSSLRRMRIFVI